MEYKKLHLDQKASRPPNTKYSEITKKHDLQDVAKHKSKKKHVGKTSRQNKSRRRRRSAHHLHIYREGELGYSVNGISNKGFT